MLLVFVDLMITELPASMDSTIFTTALPTIVGQLHGAEADSASGQHPAITDQRRCRRSVQRSTHPLFFLLVPVGAVAFLILFFVTEKPLSTTTGEPSDTADVSSAVPDRTI